MKYIKLLIVVAILGVLSSCTQRQFEPTLGDTKVEFVETEMTVDIAGQYYYIPVQMVEQSATGAKAVIKYIGGQIELKDGTKRDAEEFTNDQYGYDNGGDFLITSNEIFIGPYDVEEDGETGVPTNSFEIRIPAYNKMKSMVLDFELVGNNVGDNSTITFTIAAPSDPLIGNWSFETSNGSVVYTVSKNPISGEYTITDPDGIEIGCTNSGGNLVLNIDVADGVDLGLETTVDLKCFAYHTDPDNPSDTNEYLFTGEAVVWKYDASTDKMVVSNGMFYGFNYVGDANNGAGWYIKQYPISANTAGTKK